MKRLILAPHADDEVMGCGGLIAKYPEECVVVVCAEMSLDRTSEFEDALRLFEVPGLSLIGFPDGQVGDDMVRLVSALDELLLSSEPDEVYLPFPSLHQDHIAVYEAGMRACRLSMDESHWSPRTVLVYEIAAYEAMALYPTDLRWNVFEPLTEEQVERKASALRCYQSLRQTGPHPVNGVVELARSVGAARGLAYAEQYALVRNIRS